MSALISKSTFLVSKSITIAAFLANDAEVMKIKDENLCSDSTSPR